MGPVLSFALMALSTLAGAERPPELELRAGFGYAQAEQARDDAELRYQRLEARVGASLSLGAAELELELPFVAARHESEARVFHSNRDLGDLRAAAWRWFGPWHAGLAVSVPLGQSHEEASAELPLSGEAVPPVGDDLRRVALLGGRAERRGAWFYRARAGVEFDETLRVGALIGGELRYALGSLVDAGALLDARWAPEGAPRHLRVGLVEVLPIAGPVSARLSAATSLWAEDTEADTSLLGVIAWTR